MLPRPRPALDFDVAHFAFRMRGEEIEARPVGEAGRAGKLGPGNVADLPAALPFPREGDADGDLLDPRVVAFARLPGVTGGHGERMGEKADAAGDDPIGRGIEPGEGALLPGGEQSLIPFDLIKRIVCFRPAALRSGATPGGQLRAAGGQVGGVKIEADDGPAPPLGQLGAHRVPVFRHQPIQNLPLGEAGRLGAHDVAAAGQRDRAGGNVRRPVQQEQVLDGAFDRDAVFAVAKPQQPAFDGLAMVGSGRSARSDWLGRSDPAFGIDPDSVCGIHPGPNRRLYPEQVGCSRFVRPDSGSRSTDTTARWKKYGASAWGP